MNWDDETAGESDEYDGWEDSPEDSRDHEDSTVPCPYCRRAIYEDSLRCPHCEQYISQEDSPRAPQPWWLITGAVLCLIVVGFWILWF